MVLASVVSIIGNFVTNFPMISNVKWIIAIILSVIGFWLIYKDFFVETFKAIVFFLVQFLIIWPSWFIGGGDNSITMLYVFLMAIESLLVFEKVVYKWFMVSINMITLIICTTIIYKFPHLVAITHYTQNVFLANLIQICMIFILTAVSVNIYITSYRKEHFLLMEANVSLEKAATVDELSQVFNRRKILERIAEVRNSCKEKDIFVLMTDVDHFKDINDIYGHQMGDKVIRYFASHISSIIGKETVGRYGGDEFIIFFTHIQEEELIDVLNKVIKIPAFNGVSLTASAGLSKSLAGQSDADVIHAADELLLQAKRNGRNQILMYNGTIIRPNNEL